jgi:hypothetical protein
VTHHRRSVPSRGINKADEVLGECIDAISSATLRLVAEIVPPLIGREHPEAARGKSRDLVAPPPPRLRKAMKEYD